MICQRMPMRHNLRVARAVEFSYFSKVRHNVFDRAG
jgi:hypothetical protein